MSVQLRSRRARQNRASERYRGRRQAVEISGYFSKSELCVITKIDLLPYVPFKIADARDNARKVHPGIDLVEVSCTTGQGLDQWLGWIHRRQQNVTGELIAQVEGTSEAQSGLTAAISSAS